MHVDYVKNDAGQASGGQFWDVHWGFERPRLKDLIERMHNRDVLARFFEKHIPKNARILEAGCGMAQYVAYLHQRGFNISGLDFSRETLDYVKGQFPELSLIEGDLRKLPIADKSYDAIICLGAVEHFEEGPQHILTELKRILSDHGRMHISVPFENASFRFCNFVEKHLGNQEKTSAPRHFYQYRYRKPEFSAILRSVGLEIESTTYYGGIEGLKRRKAFVQRFLKGGKSPSGDTNAIGTNGKQAQRSPIKDFYPLIWLLETQLPAFAHMILFTVKKKDVPHGQ